MNNGEFIDSRNNRVELTLDVNTLIFLNWFRFVAMRKQRVIYLSNATKLRRLTKALV